MLPLSGHSVYHLDVDILIVCFCLLAVSQAYVNVALNKPAYLQNQYKPNNDIALCDASNAVDGRKSNRSISGGQCAASVDKQTVTWWVDLTSIHSIHHITIYFRTDNPREFYTWVATRMFGFSVYVSNTTDRLQGTLCYKDDNFTLDTFPDVFNTTCPVHGQFVIYYNERLPGVTYPSDYFGTVTVDLCEVEVYGCPEGFYGTNCSNACPDTNCYCHLETGTCQGCRPGFQGLLCKLACNRGYYGAECQQECGHCRDLTQCFHTNGSCLTGCEAGYTAETCKAPCQYGVFGEDCADRCKDTCDGCNRFNGSCDSGCHPGWQGYDCQDACDKGSFGDNCSETCGHCRDIDQCSNINGICFTGCEAGYIGDLCKTQCDRGSFGVDCNETCGQCRDVSQCFHTNGTCLTGCIAGFHGTLCKTPCQRGFFGENCIWKCLNNCAGCNNVTGMCDYGCLQGWTGYFCENACPYGLFGQDCTDECNGTCTGCNNVNGLCDRGCHPGWRGDYCEIVLPMVGEETFMSNISYNTSVSDNATYYSDENEHFYDFVHILYKFFIPVLCIFGIIGNALSFRVFVFTSFAKQPSSVYLAALSVSDTWFLSALLVSWIGSLDRLATQSVVFCVISIYITHVTSFLSVWYVVLIMLDRYIVVCHPLKGHRLCSRQRVLIALTIVTAFAILFYSYCFFTLKIDHLDDSERQLCRVRESSYHVLRLITYFDSVITFIIPMVAVFVFNLAVICSIRRFYFRQFRMSRGQLYASTSPMFNILSKAQVRLTVMLIIVSSVFLILNLPSHGFRFFILVNDLLKRRKENFHLFLIQHCLQIMYYINFAINFLLYCTSSKSFRRCIRESPKCQKY